MIHQVLGRPVPVEFTDDPRVVGRVKRLAFVSAVMLGLIWVLAVTTLASPYVVGAALFAGWILAFFGGAYLQTELGAYLATEWPQYDAPFNQMAAFGISGKTAGGIKELFLSHPPLEQRIAALEGRPVS